MKRDDDMIKEIKEHNDIFLCGKLDSTLFGKVIDVFIDRDADMEYAEKCAENLINLSSEMIDKICERTSAFHQYMLEEWNEDFVAEINEKVPCDVTGREILKYIEEPAMYIFAPKGDGIGYIIEGLCPWEPEHGIDIIIRDDRLLYVGTPEGYTPWSDEDEFICDY